MGVTMSKTKVAFEVVSSLAFEEAVSRARAALAAEGFGVLVEIDVAATLKAKLGVEREPYLILGACHPASAHAALQVAPEVNKLAETLLILSSSFNTRVDSARALIGILDPPPQVAAVTPPDGAVLNTAQPRLTVSLANEQVDQVASLAIDGLTVPLTVEGRDYVADLAQAQISLEEGHHSAVFQVIGRDDQLDVKAWSFTVETQDPAGAPRQRARSSARPRRTRRTMA